MINAIHEKQKKTIERNISDYLDSGQSDAVVMKGNWV